MKYTIILSQDGDGRFYYSLFQDGIGRLLFFTLFSTRIKIEDSIIFNQDKEEDLNILIQDEDGRFH